MASNFIKYTPHGYAESTLIKATKVGHHYNLVNKDYDIDNGFVATIGEYIQEDGQNVEDLFEAKAPSLGDKIVLILTAPKIYEEYQKLMQEEIYFYNGKGEAMRAYEIQDTDRFVLSDQCFYEDAVPEIGEYVGISGDSSKADRGFALTTLGKTLPTDAKTRGFIGKIIKQPKNTGKYTYVNDDGELVPISLYTIKVIKNEQVW